MSGRGRHGESGCPATRDVRDRPLCRSVRVAGRAHPWVAAAALCTPHPGPRGTAQLSSVSVSFRCVRLFWRLLFTLISVVDAL